ncbi:MAG TPA: type III secretion system export apparatus subunit SctR [Rhabdochlamydiaceae bacterium]|nr:type III secretion system export apparatus subunit SctR [Rhabdochlamydiaceae bacterium]
MSKRSHFVLFFILFLSISICLFSQNEAPPQNLVPYGGPPVAGSASPTIISQLAVLAALALLPFAVMLLTSYVKIVVVLSLLRNALGVQQSPPNQVLNGIALLLTVYVMFPTALAMYNVAGDYMKKNAPENLISGPTAVYLAEVMDKAKEPLRGFLQRNTVGKHITSFYQLAYRTFPEDYKKSLKPTDFIVLVPAFITSQLKSAFEIGVLIYLPFFVIDLVTSNILLAMGMMMLSPLTIALPLKLLLLVMVDGWTLIIQGLVLSFRT